ncbi:putative alcohol dehydrogenase [Escherichia coli]|uniref:Putative alcohol dehydrogenase n=1 Tax=Escherichia coli TaxID=562 RepID=A0A377DLI7_ECOLX|nr:putative alcohol dehydrogenase [Escherichia coli]
MDVLEFGGIEPNPAYETLMNAVKLVREQKVDFPAGGWRRFCTGRHQIYRRSG